MNHAGLMAIAALLACRSPSKAAPSNGDAAASSAAPIVSAPPAAPAPPPDAHLSESFTVASFHQDVLTECVDWTVRIVPTADAGTVSPEQARKYFDELRAKLTKDTTPSAEPCARSFADKPVLASCTATRKDATAKKGGYPVTLTFAATYYDYVELSEDDAYRKDCMTLGGKWSQVAPDSDVWLRARHANTRKKLEKLTK